MRSLSVGATGMMAQQLHVEVISNNIANMTTTGYKRGRPEFQDLLYQSQRRTGASSSTAGTVVPAGVQLGLGVKTAAVYRIHDQGDFVGDYMDRLGWTRLDGEVVDGPCGTTILGVDGLTLDRDERAFLRDADPWGFILFARNVETPDQLTLLAERVI